MTAFETGLLLVGISWQATGAVLSGRQIAAQRKLLRACLTWFRDGIGDTNELAAALEATLPEEE